MKLLEAVVDHAQTILELLSLPEYLMLWQGAKSGVKRRHRCPGVEDED